MFVRLSISTLLWPYGVALLCCAALCCAVLCAAQVLGEDLKLVLGQQDRMERGADTWANPVSYDKLGESGSCRSAVGG